MGLIERQKKEKFETIQVRLEETFARKFLAYCEYLDSSKDHVAQESLRYVIERDKEFGKLYDKAEVTTDVVKARSKGAA